MLLSAIAQLPGIRSLVAPLRRRRAQRRFAQQYAAFFGVYATREEAEAAAPRTKPVGYAQDALVPEYAALLSSQLARRGLESYEYPVLHWLGTLWRAGDARHIADFGGNLGTHFYGFATYLSYPADLAWWIVEVPPIAAEGERLAAERDARGLRFATRMADVPSVDLLIASGSLQYLADPFQLVREAGAPRHVLVNRLPLGDTPTFWTLQNGGAVFYAQQIQARAGFLAAMAAMDYRVVDEWEDRVDRCDIPLHAERSLATYVGFYFRRE